MGLQSETQGTPTRSPLLVFTPSRWPLLCSRSVTTGICRRKGVPFPRLGYKGTTASIPAALSWIIWFGTSRLPGAEWPTQGPTWEGTDATCQSHVRAWNPRLQPAGPQQAAAWSTAWLQPREKTLSQAHQQSSRRFLTLIHCAIINVCASSY